jgi:hypothetical protein
MNSISAAAATQRDGEIRHRVNALAHKHRGGTIAVTLRRHRDHVLTDVRDGLSGSPSHSRARSRVLRAGPHRHCRDVVIAHSGFDTTQGKNQVVRLPRTAEQSE